MASATVNVATGHAAQSPSTGRASGDEDSNMKDLIEKLFDGDPLPNYLQVRLVDDEVNLQLALGMESVEAVRRMEEVCALNYTNLVIAKLEIDGPKHLRWETFTNTIIRLLFVKDIPSIAVPERHVNGVKGRISGLIMNTLRSKEGVDPVKLVGINIPVRSVIDTNTTTSRITSLNYSPIDEQTKQVERLLKSYHNERQVPKALWRLICKVHKVAKSNHRHERKRHRARKRGINLANIADDQLSDVSNVTCTGNVDDLSDDESDGSTGVEVSENPLEGPSDASSQKDGASSMKSDKNNTGSSKYEMYSAEGPDSISGRCYVCRNKWTPPKFPTDAVNHYTRLCPPCAEVNWTKRNHSVDLKGYTAVVTGGRIKIGYDTVLKLLRNGCRVVTTTRFPHDAAKRFAAEPDYTDWSDRLQVYPLELKDAKAIYKFVEHVKQDLPHLDIIVNSAAQTIRRPLSFYEHLMQHEKTPRIELPDQERNILAPQQSLTYQELATESMVATTTSADNVTSMASIKYNVDKKRPISESSSEEIPQSKKPKLDLPGPENSAEGWSDVVIQNSKSEGSYFPVGRVDEFGQQIDLRPTNSWGSVMEDVPISELLEVMMVNTIAPYILNIELKDMMTKSPHQRRYIVNISAMEGQFGRATKTRHHPHTNMAKAALNMMTRTGALGYREQGIYMTAVDTGWVSDQRPIAKTSKKKAKVLVLPLDCVDAAARALDPVFMGVEAIKEPYYAVYLKNYRPFPW